MQHKIPRRSFLLAWLGGLLAGWLGRSQTRRRPHPLRRFRLAPCPSATCLDR